MNKFISYIKVICLGLMLILGHVTVMAQSETKRKPTADPDFTVQQYMEIWGAALKELQLHYVDSIRFMDIMTAGMDAMLAKLDPYTNFYREEDQEEYKTMTTGEYGGIGSLIMQQGDTVCISEPYEGMPAAQLGIKPGDRILSIDGESMVKKTTSYVSDHLRGEAGTTFKLELLRPYTDKPFMVDVTRRKIVLPAVTYAGWYNDSIAYISLNSFTDKAAQDVQDALMRMRKERHMAGLIFDLRGNGGGLLEEAVKIVNFFVPKGETVVETKAKLPQWNSIYKTASNPIDTTLRMVILVDRSSASASEITSGALQDLDRAVIMGERSFGKGLVQSTIQLPYNSLIKYTSAKYYIPSGRCIQAIDYSQMREDGSVGRIPDSLTHVFHTRLGREVRDGGGILPDIELEPQNLSSFCFYLERANLFLDFALAYQQKHDSIPNDGSFTITDSDYAEFCQMAKNRKFDYNRISKNYLKNLREAIKVDNYEDVAKPNLDALDSLVNRDVQHDFETYRKEVTHFIDQKIEMLYYYQHGQERQNLKFDSLSKEAAIVLGDIDRYKSILSTPKTKSVPEKPAKKSAKKGKNVASKKGK